MKKKEKEETINDRIKQIRDSLGMTQDDFAKSIYLTHGQISAIELKRSKVNEKNTNLLCYPNRLENGKTVNKEWLLTGKGDMFITQAIGRPQLYENGERLPADEEELIGVYRELMPNNRKFLLEQADTIVKTQRNTIKDLDAKEKGDGVKAG